MNIETPPEWRKGQTIFNFLEWVKATYPDHHSSRSEESSRMADPFYMSDGDLEMMFCEFLTEMESRTK